MRNVWINVTTTDGELVERIAIVEGEKAKDLLYDIDEAVERTRRIQEGEVRECEGHPAGPFDPMGNTVHCDGTCRS